MAAGRKDGDGLDPRVLRNVKEMELEAWKRRRRGMLHGGKIQVNESLLRALAASAGEVRRQFTGPLERARPAIRERGGIGVKLLAACLRHHRGYPYSRLRRVVELATATGIKTQQTSAYVSGGRKKLEPQDTCDLCHSPPKTLIAALEAEEHEYKQEMAVLPEATS